MIRATYKRYGEQTMVVYNERTERWRCVAQAPMPTVMAAVREPNLCRCPRVGGDPRITFGKALSGRAIGEIPENLKLPGCRVSATPDDF